MKKLNVHNFIIFSIFLLAWNKDIVKYMNCNCNEVFNNFISLYLFKI